MRIGNLCTARKNLANILNQWIIKKVTKMVGLELYLADAVKNMARVGRLVLTLVNIPPLTIQMRSTIVRAAVATIRRLKLKKTVDTLCGAMNVTQSRRPTPVKRVKVSL